MLGIWFLAIGLCGPSARADAALDQKLLNAVSYQYLTPLDDALIEGLLEQGADPNVPDAIGLTALQWMILAAFDNPPLSETQLAPIRAALAHGADPDLADLGSHRTALANTMAFVTDPTGELRELLLGHGARLDSRNVFGADLLHEAIRSASFDAAAAFLKAGADPMTLDLHGNSNALYYARSALTPITLPANDGGDFLQALLSGLSPFKRRWLVNRPNSAGTTPLIEAARFDNAPLVKELLQAGADPRWRDELDETALDVAEERGFSDLIPLLGGPRERNPDETRVRCHAANALPFDFAKLNQLVNDCHVRSIEELLPLLPKALRANYALVYASRSLQGASAALPRAILYGRDARLVVALSGDDPTFKRYETLEAIQFESDAKVFDFYEVAFSPSAAPVITKNPALCQDCHRSDQLRPNWDTFSLWPGVYGSENGFRHRTEKTFYAQYLANRHRGRYRHLLEPSDELVSIRGITQQDEDSPPVRLGDMLDELNYRAIARELKNDTALRPFRYALLGAVSCDNGEGAIQGFLPANIQATMAVPYAGLEDTLFTGEALDNDEHVARQASILPGAPEDFRQREDVRPYQSLFDERQKAQVYYLVKGVHPDWPLNWSLVLGAQHFTFNFDDGGFSILEYDLWHELLDPVQDQELYQALQDRLAAYVRDRDGSVFYQQPEAAAICASLKAASLAQFP